MAKFALIHISLLCLLSLLLRCCVFGSVVFLLSLNSYALFAFVFVFVVVLLVGYCLFVIVCACLLAGCFD